MSIRTAQELTSYRQSKLGTDKMLINLIVQREISNFKQFSSSFPAKWDTMKGEVNITL